MLFIRKHFKYKGTDNLKVKGLEKIHHVNLNQMKAIVAILKSDKIYFGSKVYYQGQK